jgi:trans-aconitate methyltransferase
LDLGCGTANILKYIKIDHRNYYGFDGNQEYINKAKKNFPKANFSTKVILLLIFQHFSLPGSRKGSLESCAFLHWVDPRPAFPFNGVLLASAVSLVK